MTATVYQTKTERVQAWLDGRALHIRFSNPAKHNALSVDMWEAVPPLLALANDDNRVRLVGLRPAVAHAAPPAGLVALVAAGAVLACAAAALSILV